MPENITKSIMEKIKSENFNPYPTYYFVVGFLALILGTTGLFIFTSFLLNTLFYSYSTYR